tara:strand:+ start:206 stop:445 length:240 start_codon:yes stop_codon:yes gene_type:complete
VREKIRTDAIRGQERRNADKNYGLPPNPDSQPLNIAQAPNGKKWPQDSAAGPTNTCVNPVSIESPPTADGRVGGPPCKY